MRASSERRDMRVAGIGILREISENNIHHIEYKKEGGWWGVSVEGLKGINRPSCVARDSPHAGGAVLTYHQGLSAVQNLWASALICLFFGRDQYGLLVEWKFRLKSLVKTCIVIGAQD